MRSRAGTIIGGRELEEFARGAMIGDTTLISRD
jgi:hypothetical protein